MLTGSKTPLIWPLLDKLRPTAAYQQRPRSANPLGVVRLPTTPWDESDRPRGMVYGRYEGTPTFWELALWNIGLAKLSQQPIRLRNFLTNPRARPVSEQSKRPGVIHPLKLPARIAMVSGVTRDSSGAVLGNCVVELYETASDIALFKTTSDASTGAFTFTCARFSPATHYLVAYLAGSPDTAGTSVNTLVGS
jgi:hypothetical protein